MSEISKEVNEEMKRQEDDRKDEEYKIWCDAMESTPDDFELMLENGFTVDIELQPLRWMSAGVELIDSFKGSAHIQLMDGIQGEPLQKVLYYPVFQFGCELFLKGMWLCQFEDCRKIRQVMYINKQMRNKYENELKKLGHDLLKIIKELHSIPKFCKDEHIIRFLKRIEGVIRQYYYPLYEADKSRGWANSRYPKRFYNESTEDGRADSLKQFTDQSFIIRSFKEIKHRVDRIWEIRRGLIIK